MKSWSQGWLDERACVYEMDNGSRSRLREKQHVEGNHLERGSLRGKGWRRSHLEDWKVSAGFSPLKHLLLHPVPLQVGFGVATVTT